MYLVRAALGDGGYVYCGRKGFMTTELRRIPTELCFRVEGYANERLRMLTATGWECDVVSVANRFLI